MKTDRHTALCRNNIAWFACQNCSIKGSQQRVEEAHQRAGVSVQCITEQTEPLPTNRNLLAWHGHPATIQPEEAHQALRRVTHQVYYDASFTWGTCKARGCEIRGNISYVRHQHTLLGIDIVIMRGEHKDTADGWITDP